MTPENEEPDDEAPANVQRTSPIDVSDLLIRAPLYQSFPRSEHGDLFLRVFKFAGSIDAHCIECGTHSIFKLSARGAFETTHARPDGEARYYVRLTCSRDQEHHLFFVFWDTGEAFVKIGQYPSLADMHARDVQKYSKVLGKTRFSEFKKAIGLAAHGVGVGSFVYLRRVFESLIEEAQAEARKGAAWDEAAFARAQRMEDKILALRFILPKFLVDHRQIYGILSKGVHELDEAECLGYFDVLRGGIEAILDSMIAQAAEHAKQAEMSKAIRQLHAALKSG